MATNKTTVIPMNNVQNKHFVQRLPDVPKCPTRGMAEVGQSRWRYGGPGPFARGGPGDESEPCKRARAERVG